jgi:hypothetical protein
MDDLLGPLEGVGVVIVALMNASICARTWSVEVKLAPASAFGGEDGEPNFRPRSAKTRGSA